MSEDRGARRGDEQFYAGKRNNMMNSNKSLNPVQSFISRQKGIHGALNPDSVSDYDNKKNQFGNIAARNSLKNPRPSNVTQQTT